MTDIALRNQAAALEARHNRSVALMHVAYLIVVLFTAGVAFQWGAADQATWQMRSLDDLNYCTDQLRTRLIPTATQALWLVQGRDSLLVRVLTDFEQMGLTETEVD